MISTILVNNILEFVNRIGVVEENQVFTMFGMTHDVDTIDWCLRHLSRTNQINMDRERGIITRRQWVNESDFGQKLMTTATWVLAHMGETRVRDFFPVSYPSQLLIIGEDNNVYDVTVYTWQTLDSINMSIIPKRNQIVPPGEVDMTIHIALLPDEEMANKVKAFGFDNYCILDENGKPKYYEWED